MLESLGALKLETWQTFLAAKLPTIELFILYYQLVLQEVIMAIQLLLPALKNSMLALSY